MLDSTSTPLHTQPIPQTKGAASKLNKNLQDTKFQDFVMKMNSLLSKEETHDFVQLVDFYQRKVINYRAARRETFTENFYEKVLIFFHKHNTPDLYKYFLKVDIESVSARSFYAILGSDIDVEAEYLHNANKFYNYVDSIIP